jgi:hypothetical protein
VTVSVKRENRAARSRGRRAVRRGGSGSAPKIHEIENTSWYRTRLSPVRNIYYDLRVTT